uniref:adenylate cyclase n=1 Tax=Strigamia maritima TaxID=126957 RepID=T1J3X0_STRMM
MAAVNFTRAPADRVRITLSPRRRNYRAMSTASQTSACLHPITAPPSPSPGLASLLFERASSSWWDPKFDSEVLESQLRQTAFPHVRRRFRFALAYGCLVSAAWALYAAFHLRGSLALGVGLTGASTVLLLLVTSLITRHRIYKLQPLGVGLTATLILFGVSWAAAAVSPRLSTAGVFSLAVAVLLVMYAAFPMPLYVCVMSGLFYSLMFESIVLVTGNWSLDSSWFVVRVVLHVAVHLLGMHLFIMTQVRMRSTFLKVGQSALVRRDLEMEKALKEKMIASVMPPRVAAWLLAEGPAEDEEIEQADGTIRKLSSPRASNAASTAHSTTKATTNNLQGSLFRPFNMNKMDDVSILFADIVGFTRMSSNKSAEQLVGLLNDLFGRFDALCARLGCEKISTLGDCYYCVSGCPEPRSDHARCCVRMGLAMIDAVHKFGTDHQEDFEGTGEGVNMRVGVHTGTVLCGVVGTKRFKFDVWSNDVTTANRMESTGKAGRVHISQKTYSYLQEDYYVEEGELYKVYRFP